MNAESSLKKPFSLDRISLHILFWLCVYIYVILENWNVTDNKLALFELYSSKLPLQIALAYFLTYYLLPQYLFKRKNLKFFVLLFTSAYVTCILYGSYKAFYFEPKYPTYFKTKTDRSYLLYFDLLKFLMYVTSLYTPAVVMAVIKLIRSHYDEQQKRQLLEKEKLQTELNFLKNQLHPHFLFNTLNNLYMLTLKASPHAPEVVEKLSETLDYMLYRCHERVVPLQGEIQLIENYLLLEKLRLNKEVEVNFKSLIKENSKKIAPLIMLSLVENAFKHGINKVRGRSNVDILLDLTENNLEFYVRNTKDPKQVSNLNGIGQKNIRRQLELIYPDHHNLVITEEETTYAVELKIKLE